MAYINEVTILSVFVLTCLSSVSGLTCKGVQCNDKCVACTDDQGQATVACGTCQGGDKVRMEGMCSVGACGSTGQCVYCRNTAGTKHYNACCKCFNDDLFADVTS